LRGVTALYMNVFILNAQLYVHDCVRLYITHNCVYVYVLSQLCHKRRNVVNFGTAQETAIQHVICIGYDFRRRKGLSWREFDGWSWKKFFISDAYPWMFK